MDREVPLAVDVLRRAGFGTQVARLLEYPRRSPDGAILVAEGANGTIVGVACCAAFATSGWIGALGVSPEARRSGLGTALTEAAVRWLRNHGAQTVLLYATEAGRPVYERLGFVAEQRAIAWRGVAGAAPPLDLQRLGDADRARIRALDQAVTGERRDAVLDAIHPLAGVFAGGWGGVVNGMTGWAIASPWGAGTAIAATRPETGVALMAAATGGPAAGTLIVPDGNLAANDALRAWRFVRLNDALRMRLGPDVGWHPEHQFGLFNLFWG
ncbi:acetyltransferase [Baekduia alba]|uniref:GNAT family N-acetyltransferase n=1 Tax=Baekduia alba TaxID=2997333 RepID=UPI002341D9D4|nr:GNAT family N-acetyltransferase [Baekduia alba]WCB92592.1 acetyltransferase [Baekduia alba]